MNRQSGQLRIRTPEGVVFSLPLAGPVSRGLALALDLACVSAATSAVGRLLPLADLIQLGMARAVGILLFFLISLGYGIGCEWFWHGQTVGKKLLRLRVADEQGLPLAFSQVAVRNLLRCVDALPLFYLVGGASCFFTRHGQRLGDLAARTVVVRHARIAIPDIEHLLPGKFNSFLSHPHLAGRLRQKISPLEANLAFQALLRRDEFSAEARVRLFAELRAHFHARVAFPERIVADTTDEQYLKNVAQILFQNSARP